MNTEEASKVSVFHLGKERFDLLIKERRIHLLQSLVLNGRGREERWMRALHVAASSALSGSVSVAPSLDWWPASSLPGRLQ